MILAKPFPIWLKLFLFATFMLIPTVAVLTISLKNSLTFLADVSINSSVESALKANLDTMQELKKYIPAEGLPDLEMKFNEHLETFQVYSELKNIKPVLLQEFSNHALLVGALALIISLLFAALLARNIIRIFESYAAKVREKERQDALLSSLENWQEVSKCVIHELKGSLTPIKLLSSDMQIQDESKRVISSEIAKMESLIDELTGFARLPKPSFDSEDILETLNYAISNFKFSRVSLDLSAQKYSLAKVSHDSGMIHRLIYNLIKNAHEANPNSNLAINITLKSLESLIEIHFEDSGRGIEKENLSAIFEPGFTAKPNSPTQLKNLGLGLAISRKIAFDHKGELKALPSVKGAHFVLSLPKEF